MTLRMTTDKTCSILSGRKTLGKAWEAASVIFYVGQLAGLLFWYAPCSRIMIFLAIHTVIFTMHVFEQIGAPVKGAYDGATNEGAWGAFKGFGTGLGLGLVGGVSMAVGGAATGRNFEFFWLCVSL